MCDSNNIQYLPLNLISSRPSQHHSLKYENPVLSPDKTRQNAKFQQDLNSLTGRRDLSEAAVKDWRMITCDGGKLAESALNTDRM